MIHLILTLAIATMPYDRDACKEKRPTYEDIVFLAATDCKYAKQENIDFDLLWDLVEVEKKYGVPPELRGMVLAAACMESGYNRDARGDRRFSKSGKKPMAAGILQQWPFYERVYGTDRADPISCADSWLKHIVSKLKKVDRQCKYKTTKRRWVAAWVTGIRYPKKGGRCRERPKHLRLLNRWHRKAVKIACEEIFEC